MQTDMTPLPDEQGPFLIFTNADSVVQNARFVTDAPLTPLERELCEMLEEARRIISDIDNYMMRPERGGWGVECACCMGELLDDDRGSIARLDATLAKAKDRTNG